VGDAARRRRSDSSVTGCSNPAPRAQLEKGARPVCRAGVRWPAGDPLTQSLPGPLWRHVGSRSNPPRSALRARAGVHQLRCSAHQLGPGAPQVGVRGVQPRTAATAEYQPATRRYLPNTASHSSYPHNSPTSVSTGAHRSRTPIRVLPSLLAAALKKPSPFLRSGRREACAPRPDEGTTCRTLVLVHRCHRRPGNPSACSVAPQCSGSRFYASLHGLSRAFPVSGHARPRSAP